MSGREGQRKAMNTSVLGEVGGSVASAGSRLRAGFVKSAPATGKNAVPSPPQRRSRLCSFSTSPRGPDPNRFWSRVAVGFLRRGGARCHTCIWFGVPHGSRGSDFGVARGVGRVAVLATRCGSGVRGGHLAAPAGHHGCVSGTPNGVSPNRMHNNGVQPSAARAALPATTPAWRRRG